MRVAAGYGASNIRVFGSVARGEADEKSDIDLLVDLDRGKGGFDFFGRQDELRQALSALLGYPVDVMTSGALRQFSPNELRSTAKMRERVLRDAVPL